MTTARLPEAKAAFSRGTKVELDSVILLFISGTASVDAQGKTAHAGDFCGQIKHTYKNIISLFSPNLFNKRRFSLGKEFKIYPAPTTNRLIRMMIGL